jgi:transcriptional regulator with XRE-family HTH domain
MAEFATALKEERKRAKKTLKETSDFVKRSVSYISDIEQARTGPPDLEVVRKFEEYFETKENRLVNLAVVERNTMPTQILQDIQQKPLLRDLYFRLKDMPEDELREWLESDSKKS